MAAAKKKAAKKRAAPKAKTRKKTAPTLGTLSDEIFILREERMGLEQKVKELKAEESDLKSDIIQALAKEGLTKASGELATVSNNPSTVPIADDWEAVKKWCIKNKDTSILQKRLAGKHIVDLSEEGINVPGIHFETVAKLSITKRS
jgi:hypothetical protein